MTGDPRQHPDSDGGASGGGGGASLDAYLDGQLAGPARDAFEARLARDPQLAEGVEAQRKLDRALLGLFVVPMFPGMPTNGHPHPNGGPNGHPAPATPATAAKIALSSR